MPRQANSFIENSFVKGLITEATGLNFPEQAVTSTDNCVFDEKGIVRRRLGIDFEIGYELRSGTRQDRVVTSYRWDAASGDGNVSIIVVQVGGTLEFYLTDDGAVSDNLVDSLDLSPYATVTIDEIRETECQFAAGKGFLFVANPFMETIYIEYDPDTGTVSATEIELTIRDFEGVEDGFETNHRPSDAQMNEAHEYNLLNQGWDVHVIDSDAGGSNNPLTEWESTRGDYPSNADVWWLYLVAGGMDFNHQRSNRATTPAPRGHFVLPYYDQERNGIANVSSRTITGLTGQRNSGNARVSTVEFFAGRVWYAGTKGAGYSNEILFSQIIERNSQIGQCHQLNDPASEELFDLLPSDGGVILIPDCGTIVKLFAYQDAIFIFATNGCWKVAGSEGIGFRANDYSVVKVSSIPCLTASSFVSVAGTPSFWNSEGIYTLSANQGLGTSEIVSITDTTIKDFFSDIPLVSKQYARGCYNRRTRVLSWVYKSEKAISIEDLYSFDRVLNFNTLTNAFYPWSVDISDVSINGVIVAMSAVSEGQAEAVVDGLGANVVDGSAEQVYSFNPTQTAGDVTKFIVSYADGSTHQLSFADEWNTNYEDWWSVDFLAGYDSHFVTGYKVHGEGQRKAQPTYINLFFKTSEEDSSIDFRSLWQYANSGSTGRWSTAQRVTTTSNLYDYTRRRIKSRGSGVAFQFRVDSVDNEGFNLIGWSVFETVNANV